VGTNYPFFIHQHYEIHRLFVSLFLHKNFVNIILTSLGLLLVGHALEEIMGSKKFLAIYIFSGMIGTLFGDWFSSKSTVGCAVSLFGIIGGHFGSILKNWKNITDSKGSKSYFVYLSFLTVLLNFVVGIGVPRVNTNAHMGALISGFFMSLWGYVETQSTKYERKCALVGKIGIYSFASIVILVFFLSDPPSLY